VFDEKLANFAQGVAVNSLGELNEHHLLRYDILWHDRGQKLSVMNQ
jgi:hypothetical protein